jgi:hypothetical protein
MQHASIPCYCLQPGPTCLKQLLTCGWAAYLSCMQRMSAHHSATGHGVEHACLPCEDMGLTTNHATPCVASSPWLKSACACPLAQTWTNPDVSLDLSPGMTLLSSWTSALLRLTCTSQTMTFIDNHNLQASWFSTTPLRFQQVSLLWHAAGTAATLHPPTGIPHHMITCDLVTRLHRGVHPWSRRPSPGWWSETTTHLSLALGLC